MASKEMAKHEARSPAIWDPFRGFGSFGGISELFDDLFGRPMTFRLPALAGGWTPQVNIEETEKEYVITVGVPGVRKEDVKVKMQDGVITISGEHKQEKEEKGKTWLRQEMSYGSFQRSFALPAGTHSEDVKAVHKDGVLTLTLPKPEPEKAKGLDIKIE